MPLPLIHSSKGRTSKGNAGAHPGSEGRRADRLASPATTQAQNRDYKQVHTNIQPIYHLLEHVKGPVLQTQSCSLHKPRATTG